MNEELVIPEALFVIGNGFDLQCNIKSTYEDFLYSHLKDYMKENGMLSSNGLECKEAIFNECAKALDKDLKTVRKDSRDEVHFRALSSWYIILLAKKVLRNKDWYYIENQIHDFFQNGDSELSHFEDVAWWVIELSGEGMRYLHREGADFNRLIAFNIMKKYDDVKMLSEELIGPNKCYDEKRSKKLKEYLVPLIVEKLLLELNELEKDFGKYLFKVVKLSENYSETAEQLFKTMLNPTRAGESIKYNVLSFNYTRPWFQGSSKVINELAKYVNIHGHIEPNGGKIVFGIDESEINPNSSQYIFTKVSRTLGLYNQQQSNMDIPINELFSEGIKRVIFYGHSLSIADYGYFKMIFDRYKDEETQFEFYYSVYEGTTEEKEYRKQVNAISRLFGIYSREKLGQSNIFQEMIQNKRILIRKYS